MLSALHGLDIPGLQEGLSPFGVGFILWTTPIGILERVFPVDGVTPHPAAIWLFAGQFEDWIPIVREKSPDTIILVQVGSIQVPPFLPFPCEPKKCCDSGLTRF